MSQPTNLFLPLEKMASHVFFEYHRFDLAASNPAFRRSDELGGLVREALLIHFRILLGFFYGSKQQQDDVIVSDYTSTWIPNVPTWLEEYKQRCNKLLAHLTYKRVGYVDSNDMVWVLDDKIQHLRSEWQLFLNSLPADRKVWFS
jgi:hypothetical protein